VSSRAAHVRGHTTSSSERVMCTCTVARVQHRARLCSASARLALFDKGATSAAASAPPSRKHRCSHAQAMTSTDSAATSGSHNARNRHRHAKAKARAAAKKAANAHGAAPAVARPPPASVEDSAHLESGESGSDGDPAVSVPPPSSAQPAEQKMRRWPPNAEVASSAAPAPPAAAVQPVAAAEARPAAVEVSGSQGGAHEVALVKIGGDSPSPALEVKSVAALEAKQEEPAPAASSAPTPVAEAPAAAPAPKVAPAATPPIPESKAAGGCCTIS